MGSKHRLPSDDYDTLSYSEQKVPRVFNSMANTTLERGACTPPFLQLENFDSTVGCKDSIIRTLSRPLIRSHSDLPGRFCAPVPTAQGTVNCCLPCPITDWVYSDGASIITPRSLSGMWANIFIRIQRCTKSRELA